MIHTKSLATPDETMKMDHGLIELVSLPGVTFGRATFEPGWRWSTDVKPAAGTGSCQIAHTAVVLSGRLRVRMDDGTEAEFGAGDAHAISPGHDAWVVGQETCVMLDVIGASEFVASARPDEQRGGQVRCVACGLSFVAERADQLDHLVATVRAHAANEHGADVSPEHIRHEIKSF
jgi:hypothetical protein